MLTQNLPEYWENLYRSGRDYWDLGRVSPPLLEFFKHPMCPKRGRVLVPGAGRGFDAAEWARRGFETVAVDFAQTAYESLSEIADGSSNLSALKMDLFDLSPKSSEPFDCIYEYACFCAIHPGRRDEYFEIWHKMLKDEGIIAAIFFPMINETNLDGPPHPTSEGELLARMDGVFEVVKKLAPKNSVKDRKGKESLWILKKA